MRRRGRRKIGEMKTKLDEREMGEREMYRK